VKLVDAFTLGFWIQIHFGMGSQALKLTVKLPDNLCGLVIDDLACLSVPQHRHRHTARVLGFAPYIGFAQSLEAIDTVTGCASFGALQGPSPLGEERVYDIHTDNRIQAL